jgi:hypothetical protein
MAKALGRGQKSKDRLGGDAPAMLLDFGVGQLTPESLEPRKRPFLIYSHQARVPRHIGGENGGQPTFYASRGQSGAPQPHGPTRSSALWNPF